MIVTSTIRTFISKHFVIEDSLIGISVIQSEVSFADFSWCVCPSIMCRPKRALSFKLISIGGICNRTSVIVIIIIIIIIHCLTASVV
jgi:hypothetical protein